MRIRHGKRAYEIEADPVSGLHRIWSIRQRNDHDQQSDTLTILTHGTKLWRTIVSKNKSLLGGSGLHVVCEAVDAAVGQSKESCCLCRVQTSHWYQPKDVALCPACAHTATHDDIPTKLEWLNSDVLTGQQRLPDDWTPALRTKRRRQLDRAA